jgi:hypothetical protein
MEPGHSEGECAPMLALELPASLISLIIQRKYSQELARDRGNPRFSRRSEAK